MRIAIYNEREEARAVLAHCSIPPGATWASLTGAQTTALAARRLILRARRGYPVPAGGLAEFFEQVQRDAGQAASQPPRLRHHTAAWRPE